MRSLNTYNAKVLNANLNYFDDGMTMKKLILLTLISITTAGCDTNGFEPNTELFLTPTEFSLTTPDCGFVDELYIVSALAGGRNAGEIDFFADIFWAENSGQGTVLTELYLDNGQTPGLIDPEDTYVSAAGLPVYSGRTNSEGNANFMVRYNTCQTYSGTFTVITKSGLNSAVVSFSISAAL